MNQHNLNESSQHKRNFVLFTIAIFASFAIFGIADNIRGTVIPRIQAEFLLSELHLGLMLAINSSGYLIGCLITASIAKRIGIKYCHVLGLLLIAIAGVCIFFSQSFIMVVASLFLLNFAFGIMEIAVGVIAAKTFTENTGTMMNLAHFAFGAGAVFAPLISTSIMAAQFGDLVSSWRYVYLIALSFALIPMIPVLIGRLQKSDNAKKKTGVMLMLKKPSVWLVLLVLFFGVTAENGIASWFVTYLESAYAFPSDRAATFLTLYFVAFTVARLIIGPFIDRFGFINSLIVATAFSGVMITLGVVFGEGGAPLIILAGIGIAPIFPTVMAVIAKLFSDTIELAMTAIMTMIGIMTIPSNLMIGGIIRQARVSFTASYGQDGVAMAFSAGFLIFGTSCFIACIFTLVLRQRQKKAGKLV